MAVFSLIPVAIQGGTTNASPGASGASAEQTPGQNCIITFSSNQDCTLTFGPAGNVPTPSATAGLYIPAKTLYTWDTGIMAPSFKYFIAAAGNVSYQIFSRY